MYSPFDLIELRVVFLHASPDPSDSLPEHHVGLRRHLPPGGAHLLVFILNWKLEISSKVQSISAAYEYCRAGAAQSMKSPQRWLCLTSGSQIRFL